MSCNHKGISVYIHIPFCQKKCHYCDFFSYPGMEALWDDYCAALFSELQAKSHHFVNKEIKTIFIGGGTPSLIPYAHISRLMEVIGQFSISKSAEITIEANPGTLDENKIKAYRQSGINRLSLGLQAYQDELLKYLGRLHTAKQFDEAVFLAQNHGFFNINADIIFGIPDQTLDQLEQTLLRVMAHKIPHVSCYGLKIEEGTHFGRLKSEGQLKEIDDDLDRRMYHTAVSLLGDHGLEQYEISNFAKPGLASRHNMNYWERGEYIGVGAGAHSFINSRRFANTSHVGSYIESVNKAQVELSEDTLVNKDDALSESMILGLRLTKGIDLDALSSLYGINVYERYRPQLCKLQAKKLVHVEGSMVRLTKKGMDLANQVFIEFI